jgi:hypothetical protein
MISIRVIMDCRKFHRDLENYLEDGLDFSSRFGVERHAQQCIHCGKVLSNAQQLRRMTRQLEKVKAPANFEASVLSAIGRRESRGLFLGLRRFWLYGFQMPSMRRLAAAASCLAVLGLGAFYLFPILYNRATPEIPPAVVTREPAKTDQNANLQPVATVPQQPKVTPPAARPKLPVTAETPKTQRQLEPSGQELEQMVDKQVSDDDYVEFQVMGPDNRPVTFRWPNKPRVRYGQTPEEYFLRNVSH